MPNINQGGMLTMKKIKSIISVIVSICFIFNSILSPAFCEPLHACTLQGTLAVPSIFDDLVGIQPKDIAGIKLALETYLMQTREEMLTIKNLKEKTVVKLTENTIFNPADMNFIFSDVVSFRDYLCVECRMRDKEVEYWDIKKEKGPQIKKYYTVFSKKRDKNNGFQIVEVYTENEWGKIQKVRNLITTPPKRISFKENDAEAIERYIQHEKGIDKIISHAHYNNLVGKPFIKNYYKDQIDEICSKLNLINTQGDLLPMKQREFFLVNCTPKIKEMMACLPKTKIVDENGREHEITYRSHSSNHTVHIFVEDAQAFNMLTNGVERELPNAKEELKNMDRGWLEEFLTERLVHEIGVMSGYSVLEIDENGRPINLIDKRWQEYCRTQKNPEKLVIKPVDLSKNLQGRDYADGSLFQEPFIELNRNFFLLDNLPKYTALNDRDLRGERVLVKVNLNVRSKDGKIKDTVRLDNVVKIVKFLLEMGATPILYGHNGSYDPKKGIDERESLDYVANYIQRLFPDTEVKFDSNSITEQGLMVKKSDMKLGAINILQEVRHAPDYELGLKKEEFAKALIELSDGILINDAFGDLESKGASVEFVPRFAKEVYLGPLLLDEFGELKKLYQEGFDALVFGGGVAKPEKLAFLEGLISKIRPGGFCIVGSAASRVLETTEKEKLGKLKEKYPNTIFIASDYSDENYYDIGEETIEDYLAKLDTLHFGQNILYNGTMGFMEEKSGKYQHGTKMICEKLGNLADEKNVETNVVGGDASSCAKKYGLYDKPNVTTFTGGKVSLAVLSGELLFGLEALYERQQELSHKESLLWEKGVDTDKYWSELKNDLDAGVPPEVTVDDTRFEFPDFIQQVWVFVRDIIESKEFETRVKLARKGAGYNDETTYYENIVNDLRKLRISILSNDQIEALGEKVDPEIKQRWAGVIGDYIGKRWFMASQEEIVLFENIIENEVGEDSNEKADYKICKENFRNTQRLINDEVNIPWRIVADYRYVKILEATRYWENMVDPFIENKQKTCEEGCELFMNKVNIEWLKKCETTHDCGGVTVGMRYLLDTLLLGNMLSDSAHKTTGKKDSTYLIDNRKEALRYLITLKELTDEGTQTKLHILHDNMGFELVTLFWIMDYCVRHKIVSKIVLHTKNYPYSVSDVTGKDDIYLQLDRMEKAGGELKDLSLRVKSYSENEKNIEISNPHWFSTLGQNFVDMPKEYCSELAEADLIVMIGDYWYRKLFANRNWTYTASSKKILNYLPAPTLIIRTGKCPILVGIAKKVAISLKNIGLNEWWKTPKYGLIEFVLGQKDKDNEIFGLKKKMKNMRVLAKGIGSEIARPILDNPYTLITCGDFYTDRKEYTHDLENYGSIFRPHWIESDKPDAIIRNIELEIKNGLDPNNIMVQLPKLFSGESEKKYIEELTNLNRQGVKFMVINTQGLKGEPDKEKRAEYRLNMYAMMLLGRRITAKKNAVNKKIENLLKFFITSCLEDKNIEHTNIQLYINAFKKQNFDEKDIVFIINTTLSYKPTERFAHCDYAVIAPTLISA